MAGRLLTNDSYDLLIQDAAEVYKPNGELLLRYFPGAIPERLSRPAVRALRGAARLSRNRGDAAGGRGNYPATIRGERSKTDYSPPVQSGVVGFLPRNARFPYCRMTAFTVENMGQIKMARPLFEFISGAFQNTLPERWRAQEAAITWTNPAFRIDGTVFTTVTVNKNFQTAVHKDKGDLKEGFGVMTAFGIGYRGGYLVFPEYRVAVDMRDGGLLFADVHEWHANSPITPCKKDWERLSLVLYYREHMKACGSAEEELDRAKSRKKGDPLHA